MRFSYYRTGARSTRARICGVAILAMLPALTAQGATIYVDDDGPNGDGTTWCTAKTDLRAVLGSASSGDIIRVAQGVYITGTCAPNCTSTDRDASFVLHNNVEVYGGYAGCGAPDPDARDFVLYETTLSGDLHGDDNPAFGADHSSRAENNYHVVAPDAQVTSGTILDGVTVYGGNADGNGPPRDIAGGLYLVNDCDLTITNCLVRSNFAKYGGGMNLFGGSDPTITDCVFEDNIARDLAFFSGRGGAIDIDSGMPVLTRCRFRNNQAGQSGGAINYKSNQAAGTMTECIFVENVAGETGIVGAGGAIAFATGVANLVDCDFRRN